MADLNMNAKLPGPGTMNGFVRENLLQPLKNSQKTEEKNSTELEKRQEIASEKSPADIVKEMPREELNETISQLNDSLQNVQRNLEFSIDKDAGRIVINVKDRDTDEVVRQIPSEEVLELARNLQEVNDKFNQKLDNPSESRSQPVAEGVFLKTSV